MLLYEFLSYLYHMISNITQAERAITRVLFVPNSTSANLILYNSSVNKKLIFCYILNTILSVFAQFCQQNYYL